MKELLNGLQHIGLPTTDMDKTVEFYETLGFKIAYETLLDGDKVKFFKLGNLIIESYEDKNAPKKTGAIAHIAIDVSDIEAAFKKANELKLNVLDEITFLPFWENGVKFFNIEGPNNETVEFSQML